MFDPKKEDKLVMFYVITKNTEEVPLLLDIAREYLDGFNYNYSNIHVAFKYDSVPLEEGFEEIPYVKELKGKYDFFLYIGFPDAAMDDYKEEVDKYSVIHKEGTQVRIESLFDRHIADYSFDANYFDNKLEEISTFVDRYLIDLNKAISEGDDEKVENIKKGLNKIRIKLWPELNI